MTVYLAVLQFVFIRYRQHYWYSELQHISMSHDKIHTPTLMSYSYGILLLTPVAIIHILGGISSIYTVFLLTRDTGPSETREQKRKSVRIILTLTVINWSVPIAMAYTAFNWPTEEATTAELVGTYAVLNGTKKKKHNFFQTQFSNFINFTISQNISNHTQ